VIFSVFLNSNSKIGWTPRVLIRKATDGGDSRNFLWETNKMKENIGHFGFQRTARDSFERVTLCRIVLWKWWQRYAFCEFLTTAKSKLRLLTEECFNTFYSNSERMHSRGRVNRETICELQSRTFSNVLVFFKLRLEHRGAWVSWTRVPLPTLHRHMWTVTRVDCIFQRLGLCHHQP